MDTRAVRFGERMQEKGIKVYELDLPPFIDVKRKQLIYVHGAIPSHILPPPFSSFIFFDTFSLFDSCSNISLVPIDFTSQSLHDVLQDGEYSVSPLF